MGQLAYWPMGSVTPEEKGQTVSIISVSKNSAPLDGKLPGSMPRRLSSESVKVEENTDVQDDNTSNYSVNLPQVYPKSITSKNGSGKYVI